MKMIKFKDNHTLNENVNIGGRYFDITIWWDDKKRECRGKCWVVDKAIDVELTTPDAVREELIKEIKEYLSVKI